MKKTKALDDIITICSFCHKIKDNKGEWHRMEISQGAEEGLRLSHGMCLECAQRNWPDFFSEELEGQRAKPTPKRV